MLKPDDIEAAMVPKPALRLVSGAPPTRYERHLKRPLDVVVAAGLIVVTAPLMALIAGSLRLTLGSGVLLTQRRVGRHGEDFQMVKFRTMRQDRRRTQQPFDGHDRRRTHKSHQDPRHTPLGRILRKTGLDELPQLFHVLSGTMSLVGPRPELAEVADRNRLRHHDRHRARPGLTGEWQTGRRALGTNLHECFDDDLLYVNDITFRRDLTIILRTVREVVFARGK
jgi:lipopolysaccharide/colanic/teichoic acid biosynthesis glycosyltransferase